MFTSADLLWTNASILFAGPSTASAQNPMTKVAGQSKTDELFNNKDCLYKMYFSSIDIVNSDFSEMLVITIQLHIPTEFQI